MLTKRDLSHIQKIVQSETKQIVQQELTPVKKDIRAIKKDIKLIVRTFDREYVALRRNVEDHIANHTYQVAL